jgi:predicted transcriptional regulator
MYMSNLSFDLLEKYTKTLMKRGLIGLDEADKGLYFTTERGRKFLDVFEELEKIVEPQKEERHNDHEILSLER